MLAGPGERTAVGFDVEHAQAYVDRTQSSGGLKDADVRAGPWHGANKDTGGTVSVHAYVDHSLVTFIVDNRTAFSVWVHPQKNTSTSVSLFASEAGVVARSIDIWTLSDANP